MILSPPQNLFSNCAARLATAKQHKKDLGIECIEFVLAKANFDCNGNAKIWSHKIFV